MLESVGISTAIATTPGHVFALFDTGIPEYLSSELSGDRSNFIVRNGSIWIPVEVTRLNGSFMESWKEGMREVKQSGFEALDTASAWELSPPSDMGSEMKITIPDKKELMKHIYEDVTEFKRSVYTDIIAGLKDDLKNNPKNYKAWNSLGIAFGRQNMLIEAEEAFLKVLEIIPNYKQALTNMGNVSMLKKDYKKAAEYFNKAFSQDSGDADILIGYARAMFELGRFKDSTDAYRKAVVKKPELAMRYSYLENKTEAINERAVDISDRNQMNIWTK
jgi:tetratricopeptide (TPR) repeat protein